MVEEDIAQAYNQGYVEGCRKGYESAMKATWKEQYEKLCEEIRITERENIMKAIRELYNE